MKHYLKSERKKLLCSIEKLLDEPMVFLGFVWLILLVIELIWGLPKVLQYLSITIWIVFIIDFVVKFFLAPVKLRFLKVNWLTALSLVIPALRIFRIFKFVRLLRGLRGIRLVRIVSSLNRSMKSLSATMKRRGFSYISGIDDCSIVWWRSGYVCYRKRKPGF